MTAPISEKSLDTLWNFNDPAASELRFRDYLAQPALTPQAKAEAQTQLARALGLQRKFAEAHQILDEVEAQLQPAGKRVRVRYLLERGRAFNSARQSEKAQPLFLAAWHLAWEDRADNLAVDAAHMLGIVGAPKEQLEWNLKALALAETTEDTEARAWLGPLYNNIAWTYHDQKEYAPALELFEKALRWREEQKTEPYLRIAKWSVARALRSLNRLEEALAMQQALKTEMTPAGVTDGFVDEELGECLLLLKGEAAARPHFAAAYNLLAKDPWLTEAEPARLERLKRLGGI